MKRGRVATLLGLALAIGGTVELLRAPSDVASRASGTARSLSSDSNVDESTTGPIREHVASTTSSATTNALATSLALDAHRLLEPALESVRTDHDSRALEADLVTLGKKKPRERELMQLRVGLEDLLRKRPELAPAVARAFDAIDDRLTLFALSRALVLQLSNPDVRATLLADARGSDVEARREIALRALAGTGDPAVIELEREIVADATIPASVRSAAADGLARDWDRLEPRAAASARDAARTIAQAPAQDASARESALHLLATSAKPNDADLGRAVLAESDVPARVALAAARLALAAGGDRTSVARALAAHSTDRKDLCGLAAAQLTQADGEKRP